MATNKDAIEWARGAIEAANRRGPLGDSDEAVVSVHTLSKIMNQVWLMGWDQGRNEEAVWTSLHLKQLTG